MLPARRAVKALGDVIDIIPKSAYFLCQFVIDRHETWHEVAPIKYKAFGTGPAARRPRELSFPGGRKKGGHLGRFLWNRLLRPLGHHIGTFS